MEGSKFVPGITPQGPTFTLIEHVGAVALLYLCVCACKVVHLYARLWSIFHVFTICYNMGETAHFGLFPCLHLVCGFMCEPKLVSWVV